MEIDNVKCVCGCDVVIPVQKNMSVIGIYCKKCRKWIKWANKSEKKICHVCKSCNKYNSLGCPYSGFGVINLGICDEYEVSEEWQS